MRNTAKSGDQKTSGETAAEESGGEFSMASLQLDELLLELSKEAGFKGRSAQRGNKNKGVITTKDGGGRTFLSWETEDGMMRNFSDQGSNQFRGGYYSDVDIDRTAPTSPKQKVINIEYRPKQRSYSAKVIEKTQTRQEYIKEEYLGNKAITSGSNRFEDQGTINVDGRTSSVGALSSEMRGSQFQSQKMYSSDVEGGVKVAPIPPPRKHIASPDPSFASSGIQFQTNAKQHHEHDFFSNTLSPVSSTSTLRKGRFETTNSQHISPPLEVKGITPASLSTYEEHRWLEEQKKKLERSRFSVDRITATGHVDHSYRSGSLDVDLDDIVQRNLTNRTVAVHRVSSTPGESESGSIEKGSYYISGIERPAVRTKLPQTKYIFKITSPEESVQPPAPKKMEKEVFTTHILAPPIPPSPQLDPGLEPNLGDLESSLKLMLDTNDYKEQETFNKKLRPRQDDEVISLEPIGPGVQLLEPEIGTLRGQTLKYQEGPSRIESRSNSLARNVATPRTLSPSNLGYNTNTTMTSYPNNQANNFTMFESFTKQSNAIPQQHQQVFLPQQQQQVFLPQQQQVFLPQQQQVFLPQQQVFLPQVPVNMTSHMSRKETFETTRPIDNLSAQQHFQQQHQQQLATQQHFQQQHQQQQQQHQQQQQLATQQHFQQQQQLQTLPPQPYFVSPQMAGGFKSEEYSSMKYSQTLSNGPYHQSLPASPIMGPKPVEYVSTNQNQREISIPIAVEGRLHSNSNTLLSNAAGQRQVSSSASNFNYHETESSGFAGNQMIRESSSGTMSRQIPVVQQQATGNFGVSGSSASLSGGYKFEDRKMETFRVENSASVSHPASPDVSRSWTVSPSSSALAANMSAFKTESERRNENSSLQITENRSASQTSLTDYEAKLVRDAAHIWHKPHITRQEAVEMLRNKPSGSFVVRNSHSFAGGYGLALKVSHLPPNVQAKGDDYEANLVRHYLIESTPKGVKLKGCSNEPIFPSLSALIYQHSITPLSLPCKLLVPEGDKQLDNRSINQSLNCDYANNNNNNNINTASYTETTTAQKSITTNNANNININNTNNTNYNNNNTGTLASVKSNLSANSFGVSDTSVHHGPALYIDSFNTESLTGPEALRKSIQIVLEKNFKNLSVNKVDFRVSSQGVVLTDSKHKLFFRRHYPLEFISYCAVDQSGKNWTISDNDGKTYTGRVFGFVARKLGSSSSNTCHLFLEIDPNFSGVTVVNLIDSLQN